MGLANVDVERPSTPVLCHLCVGCTQAIDGKTRVWITKRELIDMDCANIGQHKKQVYVIVTVVSEAELWKDAPVTVCVLPCFPTSADTRKHTLSVVSDHCAASPTSYVDGCRVARKVRWGCPVSSSHAYWWRQIQHAVRCFVVGEHGSPQCEDHCPFCV